MQQNLRSVAWLKITSWICVCFFLPDLMKTKQGRGGEGGRRRGISELLNGDTVWIFNMLILLNKRWKSDFCFLLACQTVANKHSFPWLELFITVWILECNYDLYLSCIIHTIIIPQLNYLFITRRNVCSVSLEDFFFFGGASHCLALHQDGLRVAAWSPWLVCWQLGLTFQPHLFMVLEEDAGSKKFQGYKHLRMFSQLSWEGLFILAIIMLWNLIWNLFRK